MKFMGDKMLKKKQTLTINNAIELGENISNEAKGKGRLFVSRFIEPGVAHYEEFGDILITKETLETFIQTMVGCPVIIKHKDIDDKNADDERVGVVSKVWFNEFDGWYYCEGIIWDKQAIDLVKNQGWSVSCTYDFDSDKQSKTHNGKKIDMEFTGGEFLHLALVPNPRYERANIVMNSKDVEKYTVQQELENDKIQTESKNGKGDLIMSVLNELESFVKGIIKNAEDEKEKEEAKNEDKRKLIDEVGGILKGKVDDEIIKTIMKKMEEASYEPSEKDKADNEEDEEKEEKFEEEKEVANKKAKNEEEKKEEDKKEDKKEADNEDEKEEDKDKDDEVDKEEVKNKCKNSMDDVKKIVMGGSNKVKSNYVSSADRFALGENY